MRTKRILLIAMTVLIVGTVHGQTALHEILHKIETQYVKYPPKKNSIEVNSETEKDKAGNTIISRKLFVIRDWPNLVTDLERAFDQEKEHAAFVRESTDAVGKNRKIVKRYFFRAGNNGGLVYQMFGTTESMTFTYAYSVDAGRVMFQSMTGDKENTHKGDYILFDGKRVIINRRTPEMGIIGDDIRILNADRTSDSLVTITSRGIQGGASVGDDHR